MCDCAMCQQLDALEVRDVDWCPMCGQREVAEGLRVCVMCAAEKPNP